MTTKKELQKRIMKAKMKYDKNNTKLFKNINAKPTWARTKTEKEYHKKHSKALTDSINEEKTARQQLYMIRKSEAKRKKRRRGRHEKS